MLTGEGVFHLERRLVTGWMPHAAATVTATSATATATTAAAPTTTTTSSTTATATTTMISRPVQCYCTEGFRVQLALVLPARPAGGTITRGPKRRGIEK